MSNVSIYEKKWIDLVFEGRNKAYGAYQLRQENSKTTLIALFSGISFFSAVIGFGLMLTSFGEKPPTIDPANDAIVIKLTDIHPPENKEPKKEIVVLEKSKPTEKVKAKDLVNPTIVKTEDHPDEVKTNKEPKNTPTENANPNGTTTTVGVTTGTVDPGPKTPGTDGGERKNNGITTTNELDRLPEFPGGIKALHRYIGENIDKPENDSDASSINVIMSFVIEKDGSMTDIKVLRSSDKDLEKAAIKVLKSLRIKWAPGYKDGEKVRTLYVQPIRVNF